MKYAAPIRRALLLAAVLATTAGCGHDSAALMAYVNRGEYNRATELCAAHAASTRDPSDRDHVLADVRASVPSCALHSLHLPRPPGTRSQ